MIDCFPLSPTKSDIYLPTPSPGFQKSPDVVLSNSLVDVNLKQEIKIDPVHVTTETPVLFPKEQDNLEAVSLITQRIENRLSRSRKACICLMVTLLAGSIATFLSVYFTHKI